MQKEEVTNLLKRYLAGNCSDQERGLLETWYLKQEEKDLPELPQEIKDKQLDDIWIFLSNRVELPVAEESAPLPQKTWKLGWPKLAAAAILLIALSIGFHFYNAPDKVISAPNQNISQRVKSANNSAMLTLADGRTISLSEAQNGKIAEQAGVTITKMKDGQLVYKGEAKASAFNKIATPKGGQYQISLPDGTKVWLNAASSLSYPAAFTGAKREVRLLGEAYFEVAKNKKMPFVVYTEGQEVMVLGTHFNVNAYEDEVETKTSLLEGSVKVRLVNSAATAVLKPGQQAVFESNKLDVLAIDVAEAIAWKEGRFLFQEEDIRSIMRKIARWYDVDVVYAPHVSMNKIGGRISRDTPLSAVLKMLSSTDKFNFKVEGRRVTVMP